MSTLAVTCRPYDRGKVRVSTRGRTSVRTTSLFRTVSHGTTQRRRTQVDRTSFGIGCALFRTQVDRTSLRVARARCRTQVDLTFFRLACVLRRTLVGFASDTTGTWCHKVRARTIREMRFRVKTKTRARASAIDRRYKVRAENQRTTAQLARDEGQWH